MTKKSSGWSSRGWQTRSGWHPPLVSEAGQSSQDQWKQPRSRGKWKEVSNVVGELGSVLQDKTSTWQKSCKESLKREQEVLVLQEASKAHGKMDENSRATIMRGLKKRLRKIREEEEAAEKLLEEVQDTRQQQPEEEMWKDFEEHIAS